MSTFTGKLGTSDSMPGNVEPGKAPSPPPPPAAAGEQIYPGEVKEGPALHGAPWAIRQTPPVYPMSAPPPAPVRAIYPGEVKQGPFLAGAPWAHFPPTMIPALPRIQNATPIVPQVYPPEVTGGPALHGAPWATRQTPPVYPVQPNPPALPGQVYPGEVRHGPNMVGAPWNHGEPVPPPVYPPPAPPTPPPPPNRGRRGAFVPRVIAPPVGAGGGTKDDAVGHGTALGGGAPLADRTRNHTAKVADVLNSLLGKFEIVHLSAKEYALGAKFIEPRAPTATDDVNHGAVPGSLWINTLDDSIFINVVNAVASARWVQIAPAAVTPSGVTPGAYSLPSLVVDAGGRITSIVSGPNPLTIGAPVDGAGARRALYVDVAGNLASNAGFLWSDVTNTLGVSHLLVSSIGSVDLAQFSIGSIGLRVNKGAYLVIAKTSAIADADLNASEVAIWLDATIGATVLNFKAKDSGGTVRTGSVNLT